MLFEGIDMQVEFDLITDLSDGQAEMVTGALLQTANSVAAAIAKSTAIAPTGIAISAGTVANALSIAQNIGVSTVTSPSIRVPINVAVNL
ncbi:hypothetical protein PCC6311_1186 [Synechococcus elongatus PCC 6311]|nr:hypothetical protein M744_10990 [Synechococcus elongatus UTEX 2973]UOW70942.1 hypothetical protein PCC7943_1186 [Synechococcus elongatus PCC 7943]UOW73663.1 hypothetical protein PCC6311_1186 [Synechococcus elongatus PCC 6311]UOW76383.1 hypothetical protein PCC6301pg_1186 [Synechococcus elongatus PCC 6301]